MPSILSHLLGAPGRSVTRGDEYTADQLSKSTRPIYGPGLRACSRWEKKLGARGLLHSARGWTDFPDEYRLYG